MRFDPRSLRFSLLAALLAGVFAFRVVATPIASGCVTGGAAAHSQGHHDHRHTPHDSAPPPCECIAHAASTAVLVETPRLALADPQPPAPAPLIPHSATTHVAPAHVLPFSIGPPAPLT
jgi:hypothetical protein